jgi:hypothetical protein
MILAVGLWRGPSAVIHVSLALMGSLLLLRHSERLLLAPVYGACLLLVGELAQRARELRGPVRVGAGVTGARLLAAGLLAAVGACSAAIAAIAVTVAPGRSVALTAVGSLATLAAFAVIVVPARRGGEDAPTGRRDDHGTPDRQNEAP